MNFILQLVAFKTVRFWWNTQSIEFEFIFYIPYSSFRFGLLLSHNCSPLCAGQCLHVFCNCYIRRYFQILINGPVCEVDAVCVTEINCSSFSLSLLIKAGIYFCFKHWTKAFHWKNSTFEAETYFIKIVVSCILKCLTHNACSEQNFVFWLNFCTNIVSFNYRHTRTRGTNL